MRLHSELLLFSNKTHCTRRTHTHTHARFSLRLERLLLAAVGTEANTFLLMTFTAIKTAIPTVFTATVLVLLRQQQLLQGAWKGDRNRGAIGGHLQCFNVPSLKDPHTEKHQRKVKVTNPHSSANFTKRTEIQPN